MEISLLYCYRKVKQKPKILKADYMPRRNYYEFIVQRAITYFSKKFRCPLNFLIVEVESLCSHFGEFAVFLSVLIARVNEGETPVMLKHPLHNPFSKLLTIELFHPLQLV